ncbi:MAG: DNA helicase UvrD [Candidatus Kerfeldbacteria bacterium]|nr:DNA helicase UvrD [Candidatus Kerfeldbacteria bacterium]
MPIYADLHIHSPYARACSPQLTPENIDLWCRIKGISLVNCADFTQPKWLTGLQEKLEPVGNGLYRLKSSLRIKDVRFKEQTLAEVYFIIGTEVACIYRHNDATRRVHHCIYTPSLENAVKINQNLTARGCKLKADGRPILGMSSQELLKLILAENERNVLIPAHIWTPWFAIFGSKSGYNSVSECFGDLTKHIFALETGLSSDPAMNWQVSLTDDYALVSHSDAHSLPNIGREADIFEGTNLSYDNIMQALRRGSVQARQAGQDKNLSLRLAGTLEFFPDEGRYHYDGHRACKVCLAPSETFKRQGICPVCQRELTIGVLNRVTELSDREVNFKPPAALSYLNLIELDKVIAQALGVSGRQAKKVETEYWGLVSAGGNELNILANLSLKKLANITIEPIVEAIRRLRAGMVKIEPGYDGEYGKIKLFGDDEAKFNKQVSLF